MLTTIRHPVHWDHRGFVAELLRVEDGVDGPFGQILVTTVASGVSKGQHYHRRKTEWFFVLVGAVELIGRDRATGETEAGLVEAERDGHTVAVRVPPNTTHSIVNSGNDTAYVLVYISESFAPNDTDTFPEDVVDSAASAS